MVYQPSLSSFSGICGIIGGLGVFISGFSIPLMVIFISRRFDPLFKIKVMTLYSPRLAFSRFGRSTLYSAVMLSTRWYRNRPRVYEMFNGYNLWQNASKFERILACLYYIPGTIGLSAAAIFSINHFIFYIRGLSH